MDDMTKGVVRNVVRGCGWSSHRWIVSVANGKLMSAEGSTIAISQEMFALLAPPGSTKFPFTDRATCLSVNHKKPDAAFNCPTIILAAIIKLAPEHLIIGPRVSNIMREADGWTEALFIAIGQLGKEDQNDPEKSKKNC